MSRRPPLEIANATPTRRSARTRPAPRPLIRKRGWHASPTARVRNWLYGEPADGEPQRPCGGCPLDTRHWDSGVGGANRHYYISHDHYPNGSLQHTMQTVLAAYGLLAYPVEILSTHGTTLPA